MSFCCEFSVTSWNEENGLESCLISIVEQEQNGYLALHVSFAHISPTRGNTIPSKYAWNREEFTPNGPPK